MKNCTSQINQPSFVGNFKIFRKILSNAYFKEKKKYVMEEDLAILLQCAALLSTTGCLPGELSEELVT